MNNKSVFICVLLVLVPFVAGNPLKMTTPPRSLVSIIALEEPCVRQGGLCLLLDDCAPGNLVSIDSRVLCPKQAHLQELLEVPMVHEDLHMTKRGRFVPTPLPSVQGRVPQIPLLPSDQSSELELTRAASGLDHLDLSFVRCQYTPANIST